MRASGSFIDLNPGVLTPHYHKRHILNRVRHGDKGELAEDLREVFRTGNKSYSPELSWMAWQSLCDKWVMYLAC